MPDTRFRTCPAWRTALAVTLLLLSSGCLVVERTAAPDAERRRAYAPVAASDVRVEGAIEQIEHPRSVRRGDMESDVFIRLFLEKKNTTLDPPYLKLDITHPGTYGADSDLTRTRVPAERATSYFLTFDPFGDSAEPLVREGTVVFLEPILGLCVRASCLRTLSAPDALGDPGADQLAPLCRSELRAYVQRPSSRLSAEGNQTPT
jgi:hypothetical protein